jgi:Cd2+/Zn2+-exporting ATPase
MCVSGIYAGHIDLSETVSRDAVETVHELSRCGVERVAMVTGDGREPSRLVASELAIDEYYAECPPAEQGKKITDMKARLAPNSTLVFVGCPDSPDEAFRAADAGIEIDALALGNGLRPADVFVLGESTAPVVPTIAAARAAKRCASISALAAAGAKALLIILAAVGVAPLWFTLVVDACVSNGLVVSALSLAAEKKPKDE